MEDDSITVHECAVLDADFLELGADAGDECHNYQHQEEQSADPEDHVHQRNLGVPDDEPREYDLGEEEEVEEQEQGEQNRGFDERGTDAEAENVQPFLPFNTGRTFGIGFHVGIPPKFLV